MQCTKKGFMSKSARPLVINQEGCFIEGEAEGVASDWKRPMGVIEKPNQTALKREKILFPRRIPDAEKRTLDVEQRGHVF